MSSRGAFGRNRRQSHGEARARQTGIDLGRQPELDLGGQTTDNEDNERRELTEREEMESTTGNRRGESRRRSRCSGKVRFLAAVAALVMLAGASPAATDEYQDTYSGHPLCCAAGVATIKFYEENNILNRVQNLEARFLGHLQKLKEKGYSVEEFVIGRGRGDELDNKFDAKPLLHWVQFYFPPCTRLVTRKNSTWDWSHQQAASACCLHLPCR